MNPVLTSVAECHAKSAADGHLFASTPMSIITPLEQMQSAEA